MRIMYSIVQGGHKSTLDVEWSLIGSFFKNGETSLMSLEMMQEELHMVKKR